MKLRKVLTLVALPLVLLGAMPAPALASASFTAGVVFECTARLPAFPTPAPRDGTCGLEADGTVTGTATFGGEHGGVPVTGSGSLSATFTYSEACQLNEPPLQGSASGEAIFTGDATSEVDSASLNFTWRRDGLTAVIDITGGSVTINGTVHTTVSGGAVAAFAPLNLGAGNRCPKGGPLDAQVVGYGAVSGS